PRQTLAPHPPHARWNACDAGATPPPPPPPPPSASASTDPPPRRAPEVPRHYTHRDRTGGRKAGGETEENPVFPTWSSSQIPIRVSNPRSLPPPIRLSCAVRRPSAPGRNTRLRPLARSQTKFPLSPRMNSKRRRSRSPVEYMEGRDKDYETSGRKVDSRDLGGSNDTRLGRGREFGRHTDRHSYGTSRESKRHDDYRRYHDKYSDDYGRSHPKSSWSDRESRADTYHDRSKRDNTSGRSRGDQRDVDSRYGEKSVNRDQRNISERKQASPHAYQRNDVGEYNKYTDERKKESRGYGNDRDHYRAVDKSKEAIRDEEVLKKRNGKEIEKEALAETREKRRSLFSSTGPNVDNAGDVKPSSVTNEALDNSAATLNDGVNAAKVAAMKAAELVNRNIAAFGAGTGRLSTDQKKKLLWGNKKSNPSEETSNRWDLNLFSDRERQEKFNKLMGVKSSAPLQGNEVENKDGSSVEVKKLEELDTNLEKHYIAGLRRRDGRTVGLGL
ncbi:unnamed protein product, partial [Urochloa humidicola]